MRALFRQKRPIGLGLKIDHKLEVQDVVLGGPCDRYLKVGDTLTHVGTVCVTGAKLEDIVRHTHGKEGSTVELKLLRGKEAITVNVTRIFKQVSSIESTIRAQVRQGSRRRKLEEIKLIFMKYAIEDPDVPSTFHLPRENVIVALKEFDVGSSDLSLSDVKDLEFIFNSLDINSDGKLDLEEFQSAVQTPSLIEEWARSLKVHQLIADAIPRNEGEIPLVTASTLSCEQISMVAAGVAEGLEAILNAEVSRLRASFAVMEGKDINNLALKFQSKTPKINCGNFEDFHRGLTAHIGSPDLNFVKAMETEHCTRSGAEEEFQTANYDITTTPIKEWRIVRGTDECPAHQMRNRRIPKIEDLLASDVATRAKLKEPEVIGLLLYTGPMYMIYNTVLRQYPAELFQKLNGAKNLFSTTIFVLVSAVHKLSCVTKIRAGMKLYRGINNTVELPDLFYKQDKHGCSGFTEFAFMSTTSKIEVAMTYAKANGAEGTVGTLLAIEVGSIGRGACIREFSQYEGEEEYLYVPFSFVEMTAATCVEVTDDCGVIKMVSVNVTSNTKTRTIEEQVEMKKEMHITAFRHHIEEVEAELNKRAVAKNAEARLQADKSARNSADPSQNHTVEGFLARIVEQCKDIYNRHKAVNHEEYINDAVYRNLVMEMIDAKSMAIAKLNEWLENDSFIRFRWNGALREVHRLWTAFLDQKRLACEPGPERKAAAVELCKACGVIVESVDEKNDLGETRLMCAAAEGRSAQFLQRLVEAGAGVNDARPDGVSPIWLAAQGGHAKCLLALITLKADVNQPANNGATPLYIAARNGKHECVKVLAEKGASVSQSDKNSSYPIHQAAMYAYKNVIDELRTRGADINQPDGDRFSPLDVVTEAGDSARHLECAEFIRQKGGRHVRSAGDATQGNQNLIISTGDISDIDGFFAIAEYAKTGSDVLFIMNYPAYIGVDEVDPDYAQQNPGLGYRYSAKQVFETVSSPVPGHYEQFLSSYDKDLDDNQRMKCAMTDMAFAIVQNIWEEIPGKGKLMFGIGGINAVNPFSETAIKNEVLVYSAIISKAVVHLSAEQGTVYDSAGSICTVKWADYAKIYMDFNGSLAFWNGYLAQSLSKAEVVGKIRGVFIMGGVCADKTPVTLPSMPNVLNRLSSATMNQLYHPQNAADFFAFLAQFKINAWTISNNVVQSLDSFDPETEAKTLEGVETFLISNKLEGPFLKQCAVAHYTSTYNPPKKPFDYYSAVALCSLVRFDGAKVHSPAKSPLRTLFNRRAFHAQTIKPSFPNELCGQPRRLFYSNVYGITMISGKDTWEQTRNSYTQAINTEIKPEDSDFERNKKQNFREEIKLVSTIGFLSSLPVLDLSFKLDSASKKLSVTQP